MKQALAALITLSLVVFACSGKKKSSNQPDFLAKLMDTTVSPSEDFFMYALGNWYKNTPIPEEEASWGIANLVNEEIYARLRKINEDAAEKKATKGVEQQIGDFWYSGMDTLSIEKELLKPLQPQMAAISKIATVNDIVSVASDLHRKGVNVLFNAYVAQDDKNSEAYAFDLMQGGLGMPNRDYYFNTDARTEGIRKAYRYYLVRTFMQLGNDSSTSLKIADRVYNLEKRLAASSRKLVDLRDPYSNYNKMDIGALNRLSPNITWATYFQNINAKKLDSVIVGQPEFYATLNKELKSTPVDDWKNYLRFHLVRDNAPYLDSKTFNNYFDYRKSLTGTATPRPRWKRVLDAEHDAMGEALGQIFVKEYFNEDAKKRYADLVEAIRDAYKERVKKLTWMSEPTKQKAIAKLDKIKKKVGYPDKWKDFSALKIDRGPFVLNMQRAEEWWHNYMMNKLGKPVDRDEWDMVPQEWNAYYNPSNNEIVLPAGQFVIPGMRDEDLDDAFVYGYAGASTIGHEITHGFDDQGRQYDEHGNLHNWWQPQDSSQFVQRAKYIIKEFSEFNPVDTLHINGEATQGENIADLGGVLLALDAFKKTDAYKSGEKIGGLTPLQRFFLGYTYSWMFKIRNERLANLVMTDVHSPAKERVNGPLVNIPEFYEAFNIKPGSKMYRLDSLRVSIW